jgi:SHS2 domain-containing protein
MSSSSLPRGFTFEDHTADMILHGFGPLMQDAFVETANAMFEMMFPGCVLKSKAAHKVRHEINITSDTPERLLFHFLNELLGDVWCEKKIIVGCVEILNLNRVVVTSEDESNENEETKKSDDNTEKKPQQQKQKKMVWTLRAACFGEELDKTKHEIGTEVKAITFHGVKVEERDEDMLYHCHIVVDI